MIYIVNRRDLDNIIYIEIDKSKNIFFITLLMGVTILIMYGLSSVFAEDVMKLSSIVASFALMIVCYNIINIPINKYFIFIVTTFFIIASANMINFMPLPKYTILDYDTLEFLQLFPILTEALILCLNTYFIYSSEKPHIQGKYWLSMLYASIVCFLATFFTSDLVVSSTIIISISILVLIIGILKYRKYPLVQNKKINYMGLYRIFLLVSRIMALVELLIFNDIEITFFHEFINLIFFIFFIGCMLQRLLTNSYTVIFKDIDNRNMELEKINLHIAQNSREIDESQKYLSARNDVFQNILRTSPVAILIVNISNGRVIFGNNTFLSLIGESDLRMVINKNIYKFINLNDKNLFREKDYKIDFSKVYEAESLNDDKKLFLELNFVEIINESEECIVLISDITEKLLNNEIKNQVNFKRTQEKMRSDFLSNISHDLKVPINVIYSAMQLENILLENGEYNKIKEYTRMSRDNCVGLITLANNLIDNSRLSFDYLHANFEECNFVEVIEDNVLKFVEYAKMKSIDLIFDTNEEDVNLSIDVKFMERIILNLISNAIKYTPEGGEISVVINDCEDYCELVVRDTGVGMDSDFIKEAFNRYSIGSNDKYAKKQGTGIGLFVVKSLAELQNATVNLKSEVDIGTTITLKFNKEKFVNEYMS